MSVFLELDCTLPTFVREVSARTFLLVCLMIFMRGQHNSATGSTRQKSYLPTTESGSAERKVLALSRPLML